MKCQFCNTSEAITFIFDKETLQDIFLCRECYNSLYEKGYTDLTIQELRQLDEIIDCQIEELKFQRAGIEL